MNEAKFQIEKDIYLFQAQFSRIVFLLGVLVMIVGIGFMGVNYFFGYFVIVIGIGVLIEGVYFIFKDRKKYKNVRFEIKRRLKL